MKRMSEEGAADAQVEMLTYVAALGAGNLVENVFDFVQSAFRYSPEEGEVLTHPRVLAGDYFLSPDPNGRVGIDCDCFSMLTDAMLKISGVASREVLLDANEDGQLDHAVAEFYSPVYGWLSCDTSSKNLPLGWVIPSSQKIVI
jgi:transglutaminase-like putative cysteine protease